jgi:hypothetical protein
VRAALARPSAFGLHHEFEALARRDDDDAVRRACALKQAVKHIVIVRRIVMEGREDQPQH